MGLDKVRHAQESWYCVRHQKKIFVNDQAEGWEWYLDGGCLYSRIQSYDPHTPSRLWFDALSEAERLEVCIKLVYAHDGFSVPCRIDFDYLEICAVAGGCGKTRIPGY